jgi:hypothetical protein
MTNYRFNELLQGLTQGMPITISMGRMLLALRVVVDRCGAAGEKALEDYCRNIDAGDEESYLDDPELRF